MERLRLVIIGMVPIALCVWPMLVHSSPDIAAQPNILLIFSDDHGAEDSGSYGNTIVRTPHLDQLASEGLRFNHAFAAEAICSPSRASLYTGLYPMRHGAHRNHTEVHPETKSLPHYLQPLGYRVVLAGKEHFGPADAFPFERVEKAANHASDSDTFISKYFSGIETVFNADQQPFLMVVATSLPHTEPGVNGGYPEPVSYNPSDILLPDYLVDTQETRTQRAGYYDLVNQLDRDVGTILNLLEQSTAADNTVVLYTSDHGAGFPFEKWTNYEAGLRVPLIVRWPGTVTAGSSSEALVSLVDLLPTFIDIAGGEPHPELDGTSVLPILTGDRQEHHKYVFATHTTLGIRNSSDAVAIRAVRDARYKYIRNLNPDGVFTNNVTELGQGGWFSWLELAQNDEFARRQVQRYQRRPAEELYDLLEDPYELNNLAGASELQSQQQRLSEVLDHWMLEQGDLGLDAPVTPINLSWWQLALVMLQTVLASLDDWVAELLTSEPQTPAVKS